MWIANVIFGTLALILLARMGKESGTARGGDVREMIDNVRYRFRKRSRTSIAPQARAA